jgi:hypothetical protein
MVMIDRRLILFLNKIHFLFHLGSIVKTFTIDAHALWILWNKLKCLKCDNSYFKRKFIFNISMLKQLENIKNLIKKIKNHKIWVAFQF